MVGQTRIEEDGTRPAYARAQGVTVAKTSASDHASKVGQCNATGLQVGHVDIDRFKAGQREGVGHFHMRVDALLAQDGHARLGANGKGDALTPALSQREREQIRTASPIWGGRGH